MHYPGAWYHAMNCGRRGEVVFSDKKDYSPTGSPMESEVKTKSTCATNEVDFVLTGRSMLGVGCREHGEIRGQSAD